MPEFGSDMYRRAPVQNRLQYALRQRPLLRLVVYGSISSLCLYLAVQVLFPRSSLSDYFPAPAPPSETHAEDVGPEVWAQRAEQVKRAFLHAYHGYEQYAYAHDELLPVSKGKVNNFNGWGVTAFDSLDTMILMDLQPELQRAMKIVERANFTVSKSHYVPYFETVIRYLGGLLSAYALSNEKLYLDRADELATRLDPIFNSSSGLPWFGVNPTDGKTTGPQIGILAEIATLQVEYTYLAKATGKPEHFSRAKNVMDKLYSADLKQTGGMFPIRWNISSGFPYNDRLSVGGQADSAHEYLLKQYLLTAQTDKASLEMYIRFTTFVINNLLFLSPTRHLLYVTDTTGQTFYKSGIPSRQQEHLSCFLPGLLALGAHLLPLDDLASLGIDLEALGDAETWGRISRNYRTLSQYNLKQLHMWAAEGLAQTCWLMYADQETGLGPEEVVFGWYTGGYPAHNQEVFPWIEAVESWKKSGSRGPPPGVGDKPPMIYTPEQRASGKSTGRDYIIKRAAYLLRPETLESIFLMWRVTGDPKWRMRGWKIFEALEREARTDVGYAVLRSVERSPAILDNSMPSYFLAETLKYLYLLFSDERLIPLDSWVLNTEAHPLPVLNWTDQEKELFGI
ncbi:hypothetical protein AX16_001442 [Volvariella volvacea WC 439]|nr:hypothetical protein AX16_001442 [Volvariella volvacea WC 439]